jgi:nitroreductase
MKKTLIHTKLSQFKNNTLPQLCIATPFLSGLYYLLFSKKFKREQHAVLKGKVKHLKALKVDKLNVYTLIRNIHRIEKGLLMKPRRDVFALDYIEETVDCFIKIWNQDKVKEDDQYKWFFDVLKEYFETSGKHPKIDELKFVFIDFTDVHNQKLDVEKSIPYFRDEIKKPNISFEDFYSLTKYRRSVRWFLDKKVPHKLIDKALLAAKQSPSACNRQPFQYRIFDEPSLLKEVSNLPMGIKGYAHGIQMLIVVVGNLDAYFDERDRHLIYIDASLSNMTFMFALETLGLSSCAINWPDIESLEVKMEKILALEKYQRPLMCMAVGYADPNGKVAFSEKRNLEYIRKFN